MMLLNEPNINVFNRMGSKVADQLSLRILFIPLAFRKEEVLSISPLFLNKVCDVRLAPRTK